MADKRTLKVTAAQAAFVVTGTGNATISIYDALHANQTIDAGNVQLTLTDIAYDVANSANIKRGGNLVFACSAGQNELNLSDSFGAVLDHNSGANVEINLGAIEGTFILQFSKTAGYNVPNRQNQGPGSL
jgi:hypothetical protein